MDRPLFDHERASALVGKHLLVGITYLDAHERVVRQEQFHGPVLRVDERRGIVIRRLDTGEERALPPDLRGIQPAPPGEYRLRTTGEVVRDPDFVCSWTSVAPAAASQTEQSD